VAVNVEIKARLANAALAHRTAEKISGGPPQILHQTDVFFHCSDGRLKLRIFDHSSGDLILYRRTDENHIRRSDYVIAPTSSPDALLEILQQTLKTIGTVKKSRNLYLVGQTRIHIDQVEGLGDFLELEVVLKAGQSEVEAAQIAQELLDKFGIRADDLQSKAYIDLLHS